MEFLRQLLNLLILLLLFGGWRLLAFLLAWAGWTRYRRGGGYRGGGWWMGPMGGWGGYGGGGCGAGASAASAEDRREAAERAGVGRAKRMDREKDLSELVKRLKQAAGENLSAVVLYGSGVDQDFREHSDLNILCLLQRLTGRGSRESSARRLCGGGAKAIRRPWSLRWRSCEIPPTYSPSSCWI